MDPPCLPVPSIAVHAPVDPRNAEIDVVGIGNALVDVLSHEDDELIERLGIPKGGMTLIDGERAEELYGLMGPAVEISGGSAANTIVGVAALGGRAEYLGKVRDDQLGNVFAHDIRATGVTYEVAWPSSGPSTGCCLILVTPDAQRTMNTYLGASVHLGPGDVDPDRIARASVLYLEGYLFDPPEAQEAFRVAARYAHDAGRIVSRHAVGQLLRGAPPPGVPRPGRAPRRPPVRQRGRDPRALRHRRLRRRGGSACATTCRSRRSPARRRGRWW